MNVLIINCVCSNTGDAAICQAAAAVMRRAWGPDTEFAVQDDHSQRVQRLYPDLSARSSCYWNLAYTDLQNWRGRLIRRLRFGRFAFGRWLNSRGMFVLANRLLTDAERDYLDAYRRADVVVATGGTYLVEQYDLDQRIFDMQTAISMKRPLLLFTQSAGPFKSSANRRRMGRLLRAARLILVREKRTRSHIRELNAPEDRVLIAPDAAFALADDDLATRPIGPFPLTRPRPRIAVSVRRWDYFANVSNPEGMERYGAAFTSLTTHLVRQYEADVTFLSTCQGAPGYHDDSHVANTIVASLPDDVRRHVRVDGDFHTPNELIQQLRDFECVVATRMHLAILALGVGTPVLPIAYEFKTTELFRSLDDEHDVLNIETLTSESLLAAFEEMLEAYARTAPKVRQVVDRNRQRAWQIAEVLRSAFPELVLAAHGESSQHSNALNVLGDNLRPVH